MTSSVVEPVTAGLEGLSRPPTLLSLAPHSLSSVSQTGLDAVILRPLRNQIRLRQKANWVQLMVISGIALRDGTLHSTFTETFSWWVSHLNNLT